MKSSLFIVVDGIDGSGKSELVKLLHNYLLSKHKNYMILVTREPTNGAYGARVRQILIEEKSPQDSSNELMELLMKDRQEHLENAIEPFLGGASRHKMHIVLCDRYYYSTISFQAAQGIDMKGIIAKNRKFRKPDIAFILDVEPSVALERIKAREKEKFEQLGFMKKVRENFLKLPKLLNDSIKIIDASKKADKVFEEVKEEVDRLL